MSSPHKTFALASPEILKFIHETIGKTSNFIMIASTSNTTDAIAFIRSKKVDFAILEISSQNITETNVFSDFLITEKIPYIALCANVKLGFEALNKGALNMLVIPPAESSSSMKLFASSLLLTLKNTDLDTVGEKRVAKNHTKALENQPVNKIIAVGGSTGASEAFMTIVKTLPQNLPPVIVVMHMPPVFTKIYAERLNFISHLTVWEAADGDRLKNGMVLVAKGDKHITLKKDANGYYVSVYDGEKYNGHKPSVDVFFDSVAKTAGNSAIGVILTGMGGDGAAGITAMRKNGSFTIGQDEESCVVYGMPKVAFELGGITKQAHLDDIASIILKEI